MTTLRVIFFAGVIAARLIGGSIEGRVTNTVTGAGIGGVTVIFVAPQTPETRAVTDDSGAYRIANIPDGQYMPLLSKDGFTGVLQPVILNAVHVNGETRVDLEMNRLASLRGRVVDAEKMPVAGVTVQAEGGFLVRAVTDADGAFVLERLEPGSYTLSAHVKIPADAGEGERMVTTFFPSSLESERAEPVKIQGVDVSGYQIQMRTPLVRRIRGVALDADNEPAAQATVGLIRPGSAGRSAEDAEQVLTDDDGKFEFAPAEGGEWRVQAENAPEYDYELHRPITRSAARMVRISRDESGPVEIRLAQPFALEVSTDWGDAADPAAVHPKVSIDVTGMDLQPVHFPGGSGDTKRIEGLFPGRYSFPGVISAPGYYLAALLLDGRDVLGQEVQLSGAASLRAVFKMGGGTVRGRAEHGRGATAALMGPSGQVFLTPCNAEGEFTMGDLPPGEYSAGVFRGITFGPANGELKRALEVSGERVKVEAGATVTMDLVAR